MKLGTIITASLISWSAFAAPAPHLDLDLTSRELRTLLQARPPRQVIAADPLEDMLPMGQRALDWIDAINAERAARGAVRLELWPAGSQSGTPIETPRETSRASNEREVQATLAALPAEVLTVLQGAGAVPNATIGSDEDFVKQIRSVDRVYQMASRWLLQEPYLAAYANESVRDVRGQVKLMRSPHLLDELRAWRTLPDERREELAAALRGICHNADRNADDCAAELTAAERRENGAFDFYRGYRSAGERMFNSFFHITSRFARYTRSGGFVKLPFATNTPTIDAWLTRHIQDEWKWDGGGILADFTANSFGAVRVTFEPGATPHVDELGGDHMVMDANRSLDDALNQWTIRHEFGHVLGFPDCYLEFYDTAREVMISYQIDLDDIMCSRRGRLQPRHVQELRRVYQ